MKEKMYQLFYQYQDDPKAQKPINRVLISFEFITFNGKARGVFDGDGRVNIVSRYG